MILDLLEFRHWWQDSILITNQDYSRLTLVDHLLNGKPLLLEKARSRYWSTWRKIMNKTFLLKK